MNNPFESNDINFSAYIRAQIKDMKIGDSKFVDCRGEPRNKFSGTISSMIGLPEGAKFRTKKDATRTDGYWVQRIY